MAIGVSYFGNRILRHVAADMDGLVRAGFTGVLHTMSENDLAYYRTTIGRMVALSQERGLEVQIGPWGLGRTFGGEAETLFVAKHPECGQVFDTGRPTTAGCPNNPAFRRFVKSWADAAVETGADKIFWDEPHWVHPAHFDEPEERWGCRCAVCLARFHDEVGTDMPATLTPEVVAFRERCLVEFIGELVAHVAGQGARSTVCLLPLVEGPLGLSDWGPVAALPGLDTLATDPYWAAFKQPADPWVAEMATRLATTAERHGVNPQLWIQGFRLGPEDEDGIRIAVAAARAAGVTDLWTWGYEACGHMSYLDTRDPARVWAVLVEALTQPAFENRATGHSGAPQAELAGPAFIPAEGSQERTPRSTTQEAAFTSAEGSQERTPGRLDLGGLVTEGVRKELADLDLRPTEDIVRLMAAEEHTVAEVVGAAAPAIAAAVDAIAARMRDGGRIIYAGAGTPGRLGVLDAAECGPTFGAGGLVRAVIAGGEPALVRPQEGAEDNAAAAARDLAEAGLGPDDAVVAISASGRTPYAIGALHAARAAGALTVGIACHPGSELAAAADYPIEIVVGPEVISGSTRLKSGSAQKLVLNTISTAVMVRLGRTYGNLMVGVSAGSEKLVDRSRRIVAEATGLDPDAAEAALAAAGGEVRTAIVATLAGVEADEARRRLAATGGAVRPALG
jgi:N-acetylmuramic acid 6-phosphate etherase